MLIVASRLQNAQLSAPKLFSMNKRDDPQQDAQQQQGESSTIVDQGGERVIERIYNNYGRQVSDFDTIAHNLKNKSIRHRQTFLAKIRRHFIYIAFVVYLLIGTLFYMYDPGNEVHGILAYYQAITIGFSVGVGTKDPTFV
jgi:hypothetical protein